MKHFLYCCTMEEIWKNIEGYPNYMVSNMGRVKRLGNDKSRKEKILKQQLDKNNYLTIGLVKDKKQKYFRVHRLVAQAFITNTNNYPVVNHKNEIKNDNRVENLEWCTVGYNNKYGSRIERVAKANSIPILQFTKEMEFVRKWESAMDVERELGFDNSSIVKCCRGKKYKSVGGYMWKYEGAA